MTVECELYNNRANLFQGTVTEYVSMKRGRFSGRLSLNLNQALLAYVSESLLIS